MRVLQVASEYHCIEFVNVVLEVIINCFLKATVPVGTPIRVRAVLLSIHPPLGSAPFQLILYNPVHSCPAPETVPEAVVPVPVAGIAVELLEESLFFAQEMTVKLKRNMKKIMGIYLTWFPITG